MAYSVLEEIEKAKEPITAQGLADILGVSKPAIYKAVKKGTYPVMDIGLSVVLFDPHTLASYIRKKNPTMRNAAKG